MNRFAMVDAAGLVVAVLDTTNAALIGPNTPPGCEAVGCGSDVLPGWRLDRTADAFSPETAA